MRFSDSDWSPKTCFSVNTSIFDGSSLPTSQPRAVSRGSPTVTNSVCASTGYVFTPWTEIRGFVGRASPGAYAT